MLFVDDLNWVWLVWGMKVENWLQFVGELMDYMVNVCCVFNELIGDDEVDILQEEECLELWCEVWQDVLQEDDLMLVLVYLVDEDW